MCGICGKLNTRKKERCEIRAVFLIFSGVFLLLAYRLRPGAASIAFAVISAALLTMLIASPELLLPAFKLWLRFAHLMGKINTQILLFIVYVLIFLPVGICMRLFRPDPLNRKRNRSSTFWEPYETTGLRDRSRYERQF